MAAQFLLPDHLVTGGLDRLSARRRDPGWLAAQMERADTRFIPVCDGDVLFHATDEGAPAYLTPEHVSRLAGTVIFLGQAEDRAYFAIGLPAKDALPPGLGRFEGLRQAADSLTAQDCALLALAKSMVEWHGRHRFCGDCGSPTESREAGHVRVCTRTGCGLEHFPRTDPAVIVLVGSGDRCLLGRKRGWAAGMHSAIAGFVEPGESLEQAVEREVMEETGVRVEDIRYRASQPWPFPRSLMLGFFARAANDAVRLDEDELETARWFTRAEIRDGLRDGTFKLPSNISIARRLIRDWFDQGQLGPLATHCASLALTT
ncbi:MAG: NAD(+) diphosphatase [Kiritimatiellae bacterium]|nr:NAD(+) diphosphatase [Kiritimatiellia bacterium]